MGFCELIRSLLSILTRPWIHVTINDVYSILPVSFQRVGCTKAATDRTHPDQPLEETGGRTQEPLFQNPQLAQASLAGLGPAPAMALEDFH